MVVSTVVAEETVVLPQGGDLVILSRIMEVTSTSGMAKPPESKASSIGQAIRVIADQNNSLAAYASELFVENPLFAEFVTERFSAKIRGEIAKMTKMEDMEIRQVALAVSVTLKNFPEDHLDGANTAGYIYEKMCPGKTAPNYDAAAGEWEAHPEFAAISFALRRLHDLPDGSEVTRRNLLTSWSRTFMHVATK